MEFLARIGETNNQQLYEHLNNVAYLSGDFSRYPNISKLAGVLHDFGKGSTPFATYLRDGGKRGSVVHSLQGAFYIDDIIGDTNTIASILVKEIIAMVVSAHHGSLNDGVTPDGENIFYQKLTDKGNKKYSYEEAKKNFADISVNLTYNINELVKTAIEDVNSVLSLIKKTYRRKESAQFALGLFAKYVYSCLIDADRLDAYLFDINEIYKPPVANWDNLIDIFERKLKDVGNETKIAKIRQQVSDQCKEAAAKNTGIYILSVPTGGGKTLSSFRFALHHCKETSKKRIIYVIPYLSIIEQTAMELRKILNLQEENNIILEHHSGIVPPDDEEEQVIRKLAASRWDRPVIITTMVQFLETVMSAKGSTLRKFHSMSDSVIIFDEIQSLPLRSLHIFNEVVSFLSKICNTTILLCSATQPLLDKTERNNLLLESNPVLIDCGKLFDELKRTSIIAENEKDIDDFSAFVADKAQLNGNCLAIVNTKKSAREIFNKLKGIKDFEIFHLSTSMCSAHRVEVIKTIIKSLKDNRKIICIATQLIEAGIDISFSCVVRAAAGLDSVIQAAGRCNRSGESIEPKEVYVIPLKDENLDRLADIKSGKSITERLIREYEGADLSAPRILEQFYKYYFYDRKHLMDYPTDIEESVYEMLSFNNAGIINYKNRTGKSSNCLMTQAFRTAGENYCVIDNNGESIVVEYGEAETLIETYNSLPKNRITKEKIDIIRKLERFSVTLYAWEIEKLGGAIKLLDKEMGIRLLDKIHYKENVGVVLESDPMDYMV